ncbi:hypothetical protein [Sphingomonas sp. CLY1604]|uniref:hypothetical protein n=1 Tax=Sphingomonas sp. CLY1604 TaxID=3457786 RepID=UPI003FD71D30
MPRPLPVGALRFDPRFGHRSGPRVGSNAGAMLLAASLGAAALPAQPMPQDRAVVASEQIDPARERPSSAIGQLSGAQDAAPQSLVGQIAAPDATASATPQLSPRENRVPVVARTGERDRATQASLPLSRPSDGRNVATPRLTGADRCDPQAAAAGNGACRNVIETRADSYANERPQLSPEQRLLAERYVQGERGGVVAEVRRVGRNDVDPASIDAQALAQVLQAQRAAEQAAADAAAKTEKVDPAVVNAVATVLSGGK